MYIAGESIQTGALVSEIPEGVVRLYRVGGLVAAFAVATIDIAEGIHLHVEYRTEGFVWLTDSGEIALAERPKMIVSPSKKGDRAKT